MEFRLLGPLEVLSGDGVVVPIRGRHHPKILAELAVEAGTVVAADRLTAILWDGEPPDTGIQQIQNAVGRLRRQLGEGGTLLETVGSGYRLTAPESNVDWLRFRAGCAAAQRHRRDGDLEAALTAIRAALAEWRGPALAGLTGPLAVTTAVRLDNSRLSAIEDRLELELAVDDTTDADELWPLLTEHPLRQRFTGLLMRTLARQGRSPEALRVFARLRERLADELGVDPDPGLVELHTEILRQEDSTVPVAVTAVPVAAGHLPHAGTTFTGRTAILSALDAELAADATAPVVVLSGCGGVGKTAAALHWAHRPETVAAFGEDRLFVDLQGFTDNPPVEPVDAVTNLLRQLGIPGRGIPSDLDDARALCRRLLERRRCLVVLDNAADAAQVRPLLLSARPSLTVVTSRNRLGALAASDGARRIDVDALSAGEGLELLRRLLGERLVDESGEVAGRLVELCARLPLALRVAAAAFKDAHQGTGLAAFVEQLRADRLGTLDLDDADTAVAVVLFRSTRRLEVELLQAFCRLGAHPGPLVDLAAVAALWEVPKVVARRLLRRLAAVHLVEEVDADRFGMHDLLREHAVAEAGRTGVDLAAARERLLRHYGARLADGDVAGEWVSSELPVLLACLRLPPSEATLDYALALGRVLQPLSRFREAEAVYDLAFAVSTADSIERYRALLGLGLATFRTGHEQAKPRIEQALAGFLELDETVDAGRSLRALGELARWRGVPREALSRNREALELFTESSAELLRADALIAIAAECADLGDIDTGHRHATEAHRIAVVHDHRQTRSGSLYVLAIVAALRRDFETAESQFLAAQRLFEELGDTVGVADCSIRLAKLAREQGDLDTAESRCRRVLSMARDFGDLHLQAITLSSLAKVMRLRGDLVASRASHFEVLDLCRSIEDATGEAFITTNIAESYAEEGRNEEAVAQYQHALKLFDRENVDFPLRTAQAHIGMGDVCSTLGQPVRAVEHWRQAVQVLDGKDFAQAEEIRRDVAAKLAAHSASISDSSRPRT